MISSEIYILSKKFIFFYSRYSEADSQSAFIHLTVGVGGDDSCDWTSMLKKMYENWAAKKKFSGTFLFHYKFSTYGVDSLFQWKKLIYQKGKLE